MDGKQIGQRLIELLEQHRETMAEEQLLDTLSAVELREKQGAHAEAMIETLKLTRERELAVRRDAEAHIAWLESETDGVAAHRRAVVAVQAEGNEQLAAAVREGLESIAKAIRELGASR